MRTFSLLIRLVLCFTFLSPSLYGQESNEISFNNRILAKVNGKPISTLDVMKRMDFLFYQLFPNMAQSKENIFQFYSNSWQSVLKEMIDRELILADAKDKGLPVSDGDIREEMEDIFGPNVIQNIDTMGLSFDEVWDMVKANITVRRMLMFRVHNKTMTKVNPEAVKAAYDAFAKENTQSEGWEYRVITFRGDDTELAKTVANLSFNLLSEDKVYLTKLQKKVEDILGSSQKTALHISQVLKQSAKNISDTHKEVLKNLREGEYSEPVAQESRNLNSTVYRIFFIEKYYEERIPTLAESEEAIKAQLLDQLNSTETDLYIEGLRRYYGVDNAEQYQVSQSDYQPFFMHQVR